MTEPNDNDPESITLVAGDVRGLRALLRNRQRQDLR